MNLCRLQMMAGLWPNPVKQKKNLKIPVYRNKKFGFITLKMLVCMSALDFNIRGTHSFFTQLYPTKLASRMLIFSID